MKRLLRRFAAWIFVKTGPVMMVITPSCRCGNRFQVVFEDVGPLLLRIASMDKPGIAAEVAQAPRPPRGGDDAFRN